jgi:hypothetical protein
VFLSSTFRDMHAERDYLVKVTFPRLRQWCAGGCYPDVTRGASRSKYAGWKVEPQRHAAYSVKLW